MVSVRHCTALTELGSACQAAGLRGLLPDHCFFYDPKHQPEAAEARRRGEAVVSGSYELEGLDSSDGSRRLLEITVSDTLEDASSGSPSSCSLASPSRPDLPVRRHPYRGQPRARRRRAHASRRMNRATQTLPWARGIAHDTACQGSRSGAPRSGWGEGNSA